jgi:anthranilate phosphoribosyltransferase
VPASVGAPAVAGAQAVRGRSGYAGFRSTVKAVGTGPRGSRALRFEEAREAMRALLTGRASDVQAGAFLIAMRIKGETPEELAGFAQGLRDAVPETEPYAGERVGGRAGGRPFLACAGSFDGCVEVPSLSLVAALVAGACGAAVVVACGDTLGPKFGVTPADVLGALGGHARPTLEQSRATLQRCGVAVVHAGAALPGWSRLAALRDEVGPRGPVHSAEKLIDWFGASRFVVGHTHRSYAGRLVDALALLGACRAVAVAGLEGSDVLRPGRPVAHEAGRALELPEHLGEVVRGAGANRAGTADPRSSAADAQLSAGDAQLSAAITRELLAGDAEPAIDRAVMLSAGLRLHVAGLASSVEGGASYARRAIADGRAQATLDGLLG